MDFKDKHKKYHKKLKKYCSDDILNFYKKNINSGYIRPHVMDNIIVYFKNI